MVRKTPLSEGEVDNLIEDYKRGVTIAKLCAHYKVGRGRCIALLQRDAEQDRDEAVGAWEAATSQAAGEPAPTRWRTSQHYMVEEPPAPVQAIVTIPVLAPDQKKSKEGAAAKKARKDSIAEAAAIEEAVAGLNRALAAIDIGSDDQNVVEEGLKHLKVATRGGAVDPVRARDLRAELKRARHEASAAAAEAAQAARQREEAGAGTGYSASWFAADMLRGAREPAPTQARAKASAPARRTRDDNVAASSPAVLVRASTPTQAPAQAPAPAPALDPAAALAAYRASLRFAD